MSSRWFMSILLAALVALSFASKAPQPMNLRSAPAAQMQPAAQPAQAPADENPKYTPVEQAKLDEAAKLNRQGVQLYGQGKYADAEKLAKQVLAIHEEVLGPDHSDTATALDNLAMLYKAQRNYAEALPLFQRSLTIREKALGPDHPSVATPLNNLASLYEAQGNYTDALPLLQRALKIREKALGPDDPGVAAALNELAVLYQDQGNDADALPLFQRALKIDEKARGPNHPSLATYLNNMALVYQAQENYTDALPLFQRSLTIREKALGPDHPRVATALNSLAVLYDNMGKPDEAEILSHRALAILRAQLERTEVVQSERQQLLMADMVRNNLFYYLSIVNKAGLNAEEVYGDVLAWKGSVSSRQQAMRKLRRQQQNPKVAALYSQLADTARQFDSLSRATPKPELAEQYRQKLEDLNETFEMLQQHLAAASADYRHQLAREKLTPADL